MTLVAVKCHCGAEFQARQADINRGWGKHCSKSCKAKAQYKKTGVSGPDYRAGGKSVQQMASGQYAKSQFSGRPDGRTPLAHKRCYRCNEPAVNGVHTNFDEGGDAEWSHKHRCYVLWACDDHMAEATLMEDDF